jgi:hypothetical protein
MPTKEQHNEYMKKYYRENKEYREAQLELNKTPYKKEYAKNYRETDKGIKSRRIGHWKNRGVIHDNFDELYEYYINCKECENCGVELIEGMYGNNRRCLDHCHKTGKFREILCNSCNLLKKECGDF